MLEQQLTLDIDAGVATITVNRPEARNALSRDMVARLTEHLFAVNGNPDVRCVVLRGAGGHFISGGDVGGFGEALELSPGDRAAHFRARAAAVNLQLNLLERLDKPVVAVAEGTVAGAGVTYVLAADYVVASDDARFTFAHVRIGLPQDCGLSYFLPRVVGLGHARRLTMTGATIGAAEALAIGLVSECVTRAELEGRAAAVVDRFKELPGAALGGIKRELAASFGNSLAAQVDLEAELVGACAGDEEFVRRVRAFLKR